MLNVRATNWFNMYERVTNNKKLSREEIANRLSM